MEALKASASPLACRENRCVFTVSNVRSLRWGEQSFRSTVSARTPWGDPPMSYTVGLLLEAPSSDDAVAFEQFNALAEGSDIEEAHPTFVAIHDELTARFPASVICPMKKWTMGFGAMARSSITSDSVRR